MAVLVLLVTPCVPGPHLEALLSLEHSIMYTLWWFGLGVASSVGLGTGAHTGTLFPVNEDVNLMTAVILFFVLLGTIGYWMCLRSKARVRRPEASSEETCGHENAPGEDRAARRERRGELRLARDGTYRPRRDLHGM